MSSLEIELQELKERNNELVKKVQYWKMTAAQRENEKLDLMKENNDLRLKLSRLRSGGAAHARKLDAEIQSASKQALSHLVQASSAVTKTVQLVKTYMQERQEIETTLPRWSSISNTPSSEKVHRVLPMLIGGQSIQPVVSLSRTMVNLNNLRTNRVSTNRDRSPNNNQNSNFPERGPLPMHLLQDLYIPLTRIDANGLPVNSMEVDDDSENPDLNNSTEDLGLDDSGEQTLHDSQNASDSEQFDDTRRLDVVEEVLELEDEEQPSPKPRTENPLEGPSWMLDAPCKSRNTKSGVNLEPDSTTECDESPDFPRAGPSTSKLHANAERCERLPPAVALACEFSPTVRRRKRTSSPSVAPLTPRTPRSPHTPRTSHAYSPRPTTKSSNNGRILKVLVSKLPLDEDEVSPAKRPSFIDSPFRKDSTDSAVSKKHAATHLPGNRQAKDNSPMTSPTRRTARDKSPSLRLSRDVQLLSFDAPSPNGATTSHVIVSESISNMEAGGSGEPVVAARRVSKHDSRASRDTMHESRSGRDNARDSRNSRDTKLDSRGSRDSDSGSDLAAEGRTRRPRKAVTYKEKPLNRKMRR